MLESEAEAEEEEKEMEEVEYRNSNWINKNISYIMKWKNN